jgi:Zn finger protein HypA/HybF involved in hydrogenase expression
MKRTEKITLKEAISVFENDAPDETSTLGKAISLILQRETPKALIPNKRIPGIGKCPACKTELCTFDKNGYCPDCGQAIKGA